MLHLTRRGLVAGGALALALPSCASAQTEELTLDDVLARHTQARGGAAALDAIRNTRNDATIVEPSFTVRGTYIANTDGLMRVDVFAEGQRVFSEGIDAEGAWSRQGGDAPVEPASETARAALYHGVEFNLFGLHAFPGRGHAITLEGREAIDGTNYYVLKIVMRDGFETYRYIDPATWLSTRRRDVRALHPDVDPTTRLLETIASDWRPVNGVLSSFAWEQRDVAHDAQVQTGTIHSLEYNAAIPDAAFARGAPPSL
ncbi:MAG: hypothetical protein AB7J28_14145 [Hyphomonadaceae bacterium]